MCAYNVVGRTWPLGFGELSRTVPVARGNGPTVSEASGASEPLATGSRACIPMILRDVRLWIGNILGRQKGFQNSPDYCAVDSNQGNALLVTRTW